MRVFASCNWEYSITGQPIGIRPGDIKEVIWLLDIATTKKTAIFNGIKLLESTALNTIKDRDTTGNGR